MHDFGVNKFFFYFQENKLLKEENGKTGIENQKLRMEVVSRSPRRYRNPLNIRPLFNSYL